MIGEVIYNKELKNAENKGALAQNRGFPKGFIVLNGNLSLFCH